MRPDVVLERPRLDTLVARHSHPNCMTPPDQNRTRGHLYAHKGRVSRFTQQRGDSAPLALRPVVPGSGVDDELHCSASDASDDCSRVHELHVADEESCDSHNEGNDCAREETEQGGGDDLIEPSAWVHGRPFDDTAETKARCLGHSRSYAAEALLLCPASAVRTTKSGAHRSTDAQDCRRLLLQQRRLWPASAARMSVATDMMSPEV
jgi:hypothetical protein